jgi:hypothetical protein
MRYLNKQDIVVKLAHIGVKSAMEVGGLIRYQGLPTNYLSPRKPYFLEAEVDAWLTVRPRGLVQSSRNFKKLWRNNGKRRKQRRPPPPPAIASPSEIKEAKA